jgi:hypothetical protein
VNMGQAENEYHEKMMRLGQATKLPLSHITVEGEVYVHKSEYDRLADALRGVEAHLPEQPAKAKRLARAALEDSSNRGTELPGGSDRHTHQDDPKVFGPPRSFPKSGT